MGVSFEETGMVRKLYQQPSLPDLNVHLPSLVRLLLPVNLQILTLTIRERPVLVPCLLPDPSSGSELAVNPALEMQADLGKASRDRIHKQKIRYQQYLHVPVGDRHSRIPKPKEFCGSQISK